MTAANTTHVPNASDSTTATGSAVIYHALPYYPTVLLERFAPFSQQPWAMLLHSGFADHPHNRFDIMVADPRVTLCTRGDKTEITRDGVTNTVEGDPFTLLQEQLDSLALPAETHPDFPFQGAHLACSAMIWDVRLKRCPHRPNGTSTCRIWRRVYTTGRWLPTTIGRR